MRHRIDLDAGVREEWFDVVDEADRVVGRALRADVHRQGLLHRAVHVWVFDRHGRIFLQKRSMAKDSWPGAWDSSASGHLDSGEDYEPCAMRELGEELGWSPAEAPEPIFRVAACPETGGEFVQVYRCQGSGPFVLHPEEIETGAWFTPAEVDAAVAAEPEAYALSFRHLWARARREGGFVGRGLG